MTHEFTERHEALLLALGRLEAMRQEKAAADATGAYFQAQHTAALDAAVDARRAWDVLTALEREAAPGADDLGDAAPSAGAGRAAKLADALDRAATVASDTITGPVEVPITSGLLREAAALLRSRAAPLDTDADWYKVLEILARPENGAAEQAAHEAGKPAVVTVPPWVCHFAARRLAALAHPEIKA